MTKLLTAKEAAKRLQVHVNYVYQLLDEGKLKGHRIIGKRWRIEPSDLEAFIGGQKDKANN